MTLPPKHQPFQQMVACVLSHKELMGRLCMEEHLVPVLNAIAKNAHNEDIAIVDKALLRKAFKSNTEQYFAPYKNLNINVISNGGLSIGRPSSAGSTRSSRTNSSIRPSSAGALLPSTKHFLFVRINRNVTEFGRYAQSFNTLSTPQSGVYNNTDHPLHLDNMTRQRQREVTKLLQWMYSKIPQEIVNQYVDYLKEVKRIKGRSSVDNQAKKEKEQQDKEKQSAKLDALHDNDKKKRVALKTPPNPNDTSSNNESSPQRGGDKKRQKALPTLDEIELVKLTKRLDKQKTELKDRIKALNKTNDEMKSLQQEIDNKENNSGDMEVDTPAVAPPDDNVDERVINKKIKKDIEIHYIVNGGEAGSISIRKDTLLGSCGIIQLHELVEGLEGLPSKIDNKKSAKSRKSKNWKTTEYGATQVRHPKGTVVVSKRYHNHAKKCAAVVKKLLWLFSGKQHRFSREAMRNFTLGGLHNYGGSDEAFQIMMSFIFKGLFVDIGLIHQLTPLMLARGIPSRRTIARYEHWFAADCLMSILYEIKSDGAIEVSLICDHGHRAGQDHFVIVICWAARDKKTKKRIYKHFCPSIDSSGHKSIEAADAIKLVLDRLLLEDVNVTVETREAPESIGAEEPMDVDQDASVSTASHQQATTLTQASTASSNNEAPTLPVAPVAPVAPALAESSSEEESSSSEESSQDGDDRSVEQIRGGSNMEDTLSVPPAQQVQEEPSSQELSQPSSQPSNQPTQGMTTRSRRAAARQAPPPQQQESSDIMSSHEEETTIPTLPQHEQNELNDVEEFIGALAEYADENEPSQQVTTRRRVRLTSATSDSGGGAAIQNLDRHLRTSDILDARGNIANCATHAMQKALQNACEGTQGEQGLGTRNPAQLLYTVSRMFDTIKKIGNGVEFLDRIFGKVMKELETNERWKSHAEKTMKLANKDLLSLFEELANASPDEIKDMTEMYYKSPREVEEPVWTRWQTMIKVSSIILDNWVSIYFLAVTIKTKETSEKYLCKVACTVISLMNERSVANVDSSIDFDQAIESAELDPDDAVEEEVYDDQSDVAPPTFYVMLLWNRAFCQHAFNESWRFILQEDPFFGSFGQCARFMAERTAVIYKQALELKTHVDENEFITDIVGTPIVDNPNFNRHVGGWKLEKAFDKYLTAVSSMPEDVHGEGVCVDRKFFEVDQPREFLDMYLATTKKGLCQRWWSDDLIYYILGGDPVLAKEFAKMLIHYKDEEGFKAADPDHIVTPYPYRDIIKTTTLGRHHTMFDDNITPIKLDVQQTLERMTTGTTWKDVLNKPFVSDHWAMIEELAGANGVVNLFQLKDNGESNTSTWEGKIKLFTKLLDGIHRSIGIHAHHQQRIENYVQMAALIAKTKVGEVRRTLRAIALSSTIRPCNLWMIAEARRREEDPEKKKKIDRVEGTLRLELIHIYYDTVIKPLHDEARENTTAEEYKRLYESIGTRRNKASEIEEKAYLADIDKALKNHNNLKQLAGERVSGYDPTAQMKGKIKLKILTKTNGFEGHINDELIARNIFASESFLEKHKAKLDQYGEDNLLGLNTRCKIGFKEKKRLLKENEAENAWRNNKYVTKEKALEKTNSIKPVSAICKLLLQQNEDESTD